MEKKNYKDNTHYGWGEGVKELEFQEKRTF